MQKKVTILPAKQNRLKSRQTAWQIYSQIAICSCCWLHQKHLKALILCGPVLCSVCPFTCVPTCPGSAQLLLTVCASCPSWLNTQTCLHAEDDPQLAEFLQLMQPRRAGAIWSNEDVALAQAAKQAKPGAVQPLKQAKQSSQAAEQLANSKDHAADGSDDEDSYQELPSNDDTAARTDDSDSGAEAAALDAAVLDDGVSDLDYLKSRMKPHVGTQQQPDDRSSSQTSSLTDTHEQAEEDDSAELSGGEADQGDAAEDEARQQSRRDSHAQAGPKDSAMAGAAAGGELSVYIFTVACNAASLSARGCHAATSCEAMMPPC